MIYTYLILCTTWFLLLNGLKIYLVHTIFIQKKLHLFKTFAVGIGREAAELYLFDALNKPSVALHTLVSPIPGSVIWHKHFGHASLKVLNKIEFLHFIGFDNKDVTNSEVCPLPK